MARLLIISELGQGLSYGHRLALYVRGLGPGHMVHVAVPRSSPLPAMFPEAEVHTAPALPAMGGAGYAASYADVLQRSGWANPEALTAALRGWLAILRAVRPDRIVLEFAPTAMLAARVAGVPVVALGTGYTLPPLEVPMPWAVWWRQPPVARVQAAEDATVAAMGVALTAVGAARVASVSALFSGSDLVRCGLPQLSHYPQQEGQAWPGPIFAAEYGAAPVWPAGPGPRVFAYLDPAHPHFIPFVAAVARSVLPTALYGPRLTRAHCEAVLGRSGLAMPACVAVQEGPVQLRNALEEAQVVACHGVATLSAAVLAGKRVVHLPGHLEQAMVYRRLIWGGLGVGVPLEARSEWVEVALMGSLRSS